jgi:hypothetical protein
MNDASPAIGRDRLRTNEPPWSLVRSEYRTRFVVAEFKNYNDPIGKLQVDYHFATLPEKTESAS